MILDEIKEGIEDLWSMSLNRFYTEDTDFWWGYNHAIYVVRELIKKLEAKHETERT